jgi:hypothetical protein
MYFFRRIRDLIANQEDAIERLRLQQSELERALEAIELEPDLSNILSGGSSYGYGWVRLEDELSSYFLGYVRERIKDFINRIGDAIQRLRVAIQRLKIKLHYFRRNLRSWIRQIHWFLFKNLDDTHIYYLQKQLRNQ